MVSLPFFPPPLPDETLYSIVSRYHRLGGFADAQATCLKLFGNTDSGFMHDFPCGIDVLCESVNLWAGQQEATIRNHTMLPFYEPFLSEASLQTTLAAMRQGDGERIKFILGLTASRLSAIHPLRACPECMNRDTIDFGSAYWHRSHQLPGVHVCGEHGVPLVILPLKTNKLSKYRYLLPCDIPRSHQLVAVQSDSAVTRRLLEISHNAKSLLDATLSPLDASRLCDIYRHGAAAAGFMLKSGKIDQQGLKSAFIERFRPLAIIPEFTEIIESAHGENSFLAALLRKPRSQKHPIKHLLLIQLLFGNVPKFLDAALSDTTPAAQPTARSRLRRSPTANFEESTMVQMRKLLLEDRLSLRAAAAHLGLTTSTLATKAEQAGIPVKRRSKVLVPALREKIADDLRHGKMIKAVCQLHHVSKASVHRLLQTDQKLRDEWEQARYLDERDHRRAQLQILIQTNPTLPRSALRDKLGSGHFRWLAKNDKDWLESVLPGQTRGSALKRRPVVDWAKRDRKFSAVVERVADRLRKLPGKPVRVTRSAIYRAIPELARKAANLSKIPATQAAIQRAAETTVAFHQRRLAWARMELARVDGAPSESRINRLAGVDRYTRRAAA